MEEAKASGTALGHPASGSVEVGSSMPAVVEPNKKVKKVVVAVHGIGDQFSYATIQSVVNQFCVYYGQPAAVPLGKFHNSRPGYSLSPPYPPEPFESLAFAEVYWAKIARDVADEKHTLEEAKQWARTIVERLRLRWHEEAKWQAKRKAACRDEDFQLTQQVLEEMIQTIAVVERICFLADRAGLFTFDLRKLLDDYLGDVQIVAEFTDSRIEILKTFADLLEKLPDAFPNADIYFVAHSEGTVVTLLGLLEALRKEDPPRWIRKVRGLMTLGSPIDKHLALWPELFGDASPNPEAVGKKIEWRNYYDFGDPVGFKLDSIREWIGMHGWQDVFNFDGKEDDIGFTRYPFPGKAHVDYWTDRGVFEHFISTVVAVEEDEGDTGKTDRKEDATTKPEVEARPKPRTLWGSWLISYVLPYVGIFALLFIASYVLYKAVTGAMDGTSAQSSALIFRRSAGLAALLYGITVVARVPRLTRKALGRALAFTVAGLGAVLYMWSVNDAAETLIQNYSIPPGGVTLGLAILVAVLAFVLSVTFPSWGMVPLMVIGTVAVTAMVHYYVQDTGGPLWPVFLATAAFLYLWWLAALVFDLIFIWHLYIRKSKLLDRIDAILGPYRERARIVDLHGDSSTLPTS